MLVNLDVAQPADMFQFFDNENADLARQSSDRTRKQPRDLALLLSKGADKILEELAQKSHMTTVARFGKTVQLYAPLYISNHCVGGCPYCGFRADIRVLRKDLTQENIIEEAVLIASKGIRHILIVSGEDPRRVNIQRLEKVIKALKEIVPSVSIEVPPLETDGYKALAAAGLDGVTLYQETYDSKLYATYHIRGPKSDFAFRLNALDRAGQAGIHKLTIGALFGLAPWRKEALSLGLHAAKLQKKHWMSHVSIGLPRIKNAPSDFAIQYPVDDRSFAQIIIALRIFLEDAGLVLSTREPAALRENLLPLGITQMSAGSKTEPGGYTNPGAAAVQFLVSDEREPKDVADSLISLGYDPIWKDWERDFGNTARRNI